MKCLDHNINTSGGTPRRGPAWTWPLIVVGLLAVHVGGMVTAVVLATSDKSFVVLPNHYQRAQHWDERKAAIAASDRLRWTRTLSIHSEPSGGASSDVQVVTLQMTNASKQPIDNLAVDIAASPERKPNNVQTLRLKPIGEGRYVGSLRATLGGVWTFEIDAKRDNERYIATASPWISGK